MAKFPDVVVLVPGISGSVLTKDGRELWGTSAGAIARAIFSRGNSIRELELGQDDPNLDELGDGVVSPALVHDLHLIPGLWKIDGYTKIAQRLVERLELIRGQNFFEFPYDWRRDNRVAARRLGRVAPQWLRAWRERSGNASAKLAFIVHSMGGLVTRYYLEVLGGWKETRSLFSVGTPYAGSLNALGFLANGYSKGIGPLSVDFSKVLASYTSVYQLLPIYPCIDVGVRPLRRITDPDCAIPGVDPVKAKAAADFHSEIAMARAANAKSDDYARGRYGIHPIVGREQPTFQSAKFAGGKTTLLREHDGKDDSGDGTVPLVSAIPEERQSGNQDNQVMVAAECHGSLQNLEAVLVQLVGALEIEQIDFSQYRSAFDRQIRLSLDIDDVYPADKPNEVIVRPNARVPAVTGLIQDAATARNVKRVDFRPSGDGAYRGRFTLPAGAYRLVVSVSSNVPPVTDVFMVAE